MALTAIAAEVYLMFAPNTRQLVADLMTIDPVVIAADAPIEEAERLMRTYRVSGLPVVDSHGGLVGVISQTDFIHLDSPDVRSLIRHEGSGVRVGEVMSRPAVTVPMTSGLVEAARLMVTERIHRLVVVDEEQRPRGVLSAIDFASLVAEG
jgi:CBS domain-containing protein